MTTVNPTDDQLCSQTQVHTTSYAAAVGAKVFLKLKVEFFEVFQREESREFEKKTTFLLGALWSSCQYTESTGLFAHSVQKATRSAILYTNEVCVLAVLPAV